jgi:ubiquinone/menaquinone biosynthesis C-methylase UbiE
VAQWQGLYEETYRRQHDVALDFDISGWHSSYTGQPIPAAEMREWVETTVAELKALQPQQVLEIGCGTGLLLARLAPHCAEYWAVDYSAQVVQQVAALRASRPELAQVVLEQRLADDFRGLPEQHFDLVILNSVIQYFPGLDYLQRVLAGAIRVLKPGGRLYLGDMRSYALLDAYHASVQLYQADAGWTRTQLAERVQAHRLDEEELTIDPAFFYTLPQHLPAVRDVQVWLKRGRAHNELTRFRYQVLAQLHQAEERQEDQATGRHEAQSAGAWQEWEQIDGNLVALRHHLQQEQPTWLALRGVPNARLMAERQTLAWLAADHTQSVGHLRQQLGAAPLGIDPADIYALGAALGYQVLIRPALLGSLDSMEVYFQQGTGSPLLAPPPALPPAAHASYANNPLLGKLYRQRLPQWRCHLQARLPEYMLPAHFVLLDALPLTPNGKIDRKALPAPVRLLTTRSADFTPPHTPSEVTVARIWGEVLGLPQISRHDNFFAIGGHSLLATQVMARLNNTFQLQLLLRLLFEHPTVSELAQQIDALQLIQEMAMAPTNPTREEEEETW